MSAEPDVVGDRLDTTGDVQTSPGSIEIWFRRVLLVAIAALVLAAALGAVGVERRRTEAVGAGLRLEVEYASATRGGLATPFEVSVSTEDGSPLPERLEVLIDARYLEMFDENGLTPEPADSWNDGQTVTWTYEPAGADRLTVSFDARLEPAVQWGRDGRVAVVVSDQERVAVSLRTSVLP